MSLQDCARLAAMIEGRGRQVRTHCFISATFADAKNQRWAWHTADAGGISRTFSTSLFASFAECVDDARAHGYNHVEVPALGESRPAQSPVTASEAAGAARGMAGPEDDAARDIPPFVLDPV